MTKRVLSGCLILAIVAMMTFSPVSASEEKTDNTSGRIVWEELEKRIRTGNLNSLALDKNVGSIEVVDYDYLYNSLQKQLREISSAQSFFAETGNYEGLSTLNQSVASMRSTYEDIKAGKLQRDSENAVKQLRDAQNQVVTAGQMLYINILDMEQSLIDGERGIETLDRKLKELRLRCEFGQVSKTTVEELEYTRANTVSTLDTLRSTISSCKAQLQLLIGETPTGEAEMGELPVLSGNETEGIEVEADLILAKEKNWNINNAAITVEKAKEDVDAIKKEYINGDAKGYQMMALQRTAEAAELTYRATVGDFEFSFREAFRQMRNAKQVLENKNSAVEYQKKKLALSKKQYELGRLSYFSYLDAQDDLKKAESEAKSAERDVFTALNKYNNAVKYGIIG